MANEQSIYFPNYLLNDEQINRTYNLVYLLLITNRSVFYHEHTWITYRQILRFYRRKSERASEVTLAQESLQSMIDQKMVSLVDPTLDLATAKVDTIIELRIDPSVFSNHKYKGFVFMNPQHFYSIMYSHIKVSPDRLLSVFLYIYKTMHHRTKDEGLVDNPEIFWRSIDTMVQDLHMSRKTVNTSLKFLVTNDIIVKMDMGFVHLEDGHVKHLTNIYAISGPASGAELMSGYYHIMQLNTGRSFKEELEHSLKSFERSHQLSDQNAQDAFDSVAHTERPYTE